MASERERYHHGDLRRALLEAAAAEIAEVGPSAVSLRSIARRAGVSHAAPAHHFGDRAGLLTAVATEGFKRLNDAMVATSGQPERESGMSDDQHLVDLGRTYVRFAMANPGEFAVMFRPDVIDSSDPELTAHGGAVFGHLTDAIAVIPGAVCEGESPDVAAARAWSLVHGLATLIIAGSLPADDDLIDGVISGG